MIVLGEYPQGYGNVICVSNSPDMGDVVSIDCIFYTIIEVADIFSGRRNVFLDRPLEKPAGFGTQVYKIGRWDDHRKEKRVNFKLLPLLIASLLVVAVLILVGRVHGQEVRQYPQQREVKTGFGWVVDDLESHAKAGHPMRNEADPANWVHELVHQVASDIRTQTDENDNAFYLLHGMYVILPEPKVTLEQVAAMVHKSRRNDTFKEYLVDSAKDRVMNHNGRRIRVEGWNNHPLFILDEANAFTTAVLYYATDGKPDEWYRHRRRKAGEFLYFAKVLVAAVKFYDPQYPALDELDRYVGWHTKRTEDILAKAP